MDEEIIYPTTSEDDETPMDDGEHDLSAWDHIDDDNWRKKQQPGALMPR